MVSLPILGLVPKLEHQIGIHLGRVFKSTKEMLQLRLNCFPMSLPVSLHKTKKKQGYDWPIVEQKYLQIFRDKRDERTMGALRCRFYRVLTDWGVKHVRDQYQTRSFRRGSSDSGFDTAEYGVVVSYAENFLAIAAKFHRTVPTVYTTG